ncbi:MAG TPA: hypothetical protein GX513_06475 [Firmicutes bacterium]|nr:hypothetical protein [Bacillota bacterium]
MLSDPSYLENCAQGIFWGTVGYLLDHPWPHREGFRLHHASQPQETVVSGPAVAGPPFTGLGPSVPLSPAPQTHAPPVSPPAVPAPPVSAPPVSAPGPGAAERAEQVERAGQAEWPEPPAPGSAQATTSSPRTVVTGGRVVVPGGSAGFSGGRVVTGRVVTPDKGTLGSGSHASGQVEVRKPFG